MGGKFGVHKYTFHVSLKRIYLERLFIRKNRKIASHPQQQWKKSVTVMVHGVAIADPVTARSISVAKALASERALVILRDDTSENALSRLCDCGKPMVVDSHQQGDVNAENVTPDSVVDMEVEECTMTVEN
jgi:hypothetical protein